MTESSNYDTHPLPAPSLGRYLAVTMYESLLLFGILFLAALLVLPFTRDYLATGERLPFWYTLYLILVIFWYFAWQWLHGGQTLAMKTWRVQLRSVKGGKITWWQTVRRFVVAFGLWFGAGLGGYWGWFNEQWLWASAIWLVFMLGIGGLWWRADKRTWPDLASETRLVRLPKSS